MKHSTLAEKFPELAKQWHPTKNGDLTPQTIAPHSNREVWWQCEYGHEWRTSVNNRSKGHRCPYCTGRYLSPGVNDLLSQRPEVASEWHPWRNEDLHPSEIAVCSNKKVWWLCEQGHEWQTQVSHRTGMHSTGCPICKANRLQPGLNDAATMHPELVEQIVPDKNIGKSLSQVACSSKEYFVWRCKQGHEWTARVRQRTAGYGCPYCSGMRVIPGKTDLRTVCPALAEEWHPTKNRTLKLDQVAKNSDIQAWWQCKICGYEWQAMIWVRVRGAGCPFCNRTVRVVPGKNDLKSQFPEIAQQWDYEKNDKFIPETVTQYSNRKVWWLCEHGHSWFAPIYSRTMLGSGCPLCSGLEKRKV